MSATVPASALPAQTLTSLDRRATDRRRRPTPMLSRYAILGGRREGDRRIVGSPNSYVDRYETWLAAALVSIAGLCAFDAVFTLLYIQKGGGEANPIMEELIGWGPVPFLIVKCLVTNVGLVVLCLHKNFRYVKAVIGALLGVYSALLVYHLWLAAMVK